MRMRKARSCALLLIALFFGSAHAQFAPENPLTISSLTAGNEFGIFTDDFYEDPANASVPVPNNRIYADTSDFHDSGDIPEVLKRGRCKAIYTASTDSSSSSATLIVFGVDVVNQVIVWMSDDVATPAWLSGGFSDLTHNIDLLGDVASGWSAEYAAGATVTLQGQNDGTQPQYIVSVCRASRQVRPVPDVSADNGFYRYVGASAQIAESTTFKVGAVERLQGTSGAVSVDIYDTGTGTGTSGVDYTAISPTTKNWADTVDGQVDGIDLSALAIASDKTVILGLQTAVGGIAAFETQQTFTVTLRNGGSGTTYYICYNATDCNAGAGSGWSTGNDGNNGTARATPWKCPKGMQGNLGPGDTVIMGDGTYTHANCTNGGTSGFLLTITADGTAGNEITIRGENACSLTLGSANSCPTVWDGEEHQDNKQCRTKRLVGPEGSS